MNYAIIENGVVVNIIVGLPDGMEGVCVDDLNVAIGDRHENGEFIKPAPPEPPSIPDQIAALRAQIAALEAQL